MAPARRPRRKWLLIAAVPIVLLATAAVLWPSPRLSPFKLAIMAGNKADWLGRVDWLRISNVEDPAGRFLYLYNLQNHSWCHTSIWQFDLAREEIASEISGAIGEGVEHWYWLTPQNAASAELGFLAQAHWKSFTPQRRGLLTTAWETLRSQGESITLAPRQQWRWDFGQQKLELVREVPPNVPGVSVLSPDGRLWLAISDVGGMTVRVQDAASGRVRAKFPIAVKGGWSSGQLVWGADSKSFVVFDERGVRWIDVATKAVRAEHSWYQLAEVMASRVRAQAFFVDAAGRTLVVFTDANYNPLASWTGDRVLTYVWELPANKWYPAGGGFLNGSTLDRGGRARIDFVKADEPDVDGVVVTRSPIPSDGSREILARRVPRAESSRVVANPNRLVWTTANNELWMLPLDGKSEARRVWPKAQVGQTSAAR